MISELPKLCILGPTLLAALLLAPAGLAQEPPEEPDALESLETSPRNANYRLGVELDPEQKLLTGKARLRWRNLQAAATDELPFHLYWNAWRNTRSTWMREMRIRRGKDPAKGLEPGDWGWIEVDDVRLGDDSLLSAFEFADPEGNPDDRTVAVLKLPRPVEPGQEIEVELDFRAKIPRTLARTGFRGDYFFIAHWFPKLGVYEEDGWNCHPFHASTEFYSDYGVYEVEITVPRDFVVGATGREELATPGPDGETTYLYRAEDVHGFTWTASPDYEVHEERFESPGLPEVGMRLLLQGEHREQAERLFAATRATLERYGRWYGPYGYDHLTIVDPVFESGTGGMEYPTLFTAGTRIFNPLGGGSPEGVTIHEAGHQFWYGLVANNEFEHAWLDEGLNTFSTARVYDEVFGERSWVLRFLDPPKTDYGGFLAYRLDEVKKSRAVYGNRAERFLRAGAESAGPMTVPTFRYQPDLAARLSYDKTSLWLATLENHLGWETLREILSTFFQRYRFRHPGPEDFFATANEVAGQDLTWFFDQVYERSVDFDYAVDSVASFPPTAGWVERGGEAVYVAPGEVAEPPIYRTEVVVRRLGVGVFPVDVLLVFEDGTEVRHRWDGRERWRLFVEERPAKLVYAAVDPERVLLLDLRHRNNTRLRQPENDLAATKWASRWLVWLQDLLHTFTFFI